MVARATAQIGKVLALAQTGRFRAALSLLDTRCASDSVASGSPEVLLLGAELCERTGQHDRAINLLAQAKAIPKLPTSLAARAWLVEGSLAQHRGHRSEAEEAFCTAAEIALSGEDPTLCCWARVRAMRVVEDGITRPSASDPEGLEREILRLGNQNLAITFHIYRAELDAKAGRLERSEDHTSIAESLLEDTDHLGLTGLVQVQRSCLAYLQGHFAAALGQALRAFLTAQESGHHCTLCVSLTNVGASYLALGQPTRAERVLQRAIEIARPDTTVHTLSRETLAEVWLASRELDRCAVLLDEVDQQKDSAAQEFSAWHEAWVLTTRVRLMQACGNWSGSLDLLRDSAIRAQGNRESAVLQRMILLEVAALIHLDRTSEAHDTLAKLERNAPLRSPLLVCQSVALAACLNQRLGNVAKSECQFRMALGMLSAAGEPADMLDCVAEYAELLSSRSDGCKGGATPWALLPVRRPTTVYSGLRYCTSLGSTSPGTLSDTLIGILCVSSQREHHPKLVGELALRLLARAEATSEGALIESESGRPDRVLATCGVDGSSNLRNASCPDLDVPLGGRGRHCYRIRASMLPTLEAAEIGQAIAALFGGLGPKKPEAPQTEPGLTTSAVPHVDVPTGAVFASASMSALFSSARRSAATEGAVLITGESGTGKEVLARFVHATSARSAAQFLPFNCSTVPKEMIDSQLFGYRRGAFTGAVESFGGVIHGAASGTLFLDEISELPLEVQPKLLRFLDSREVHSLGESLPRTANVRVVAASNVDLEELTATGRFRKDLYYRLNVFRLRIPPLRERRADIEALLDKFLADCQRQLKKSGVSLSRAARTRLMLYDWPGNVRELASEVFRLVAQAANGQVLDYSALSPEVLCRPTRRSQQSGRPSAPSHQLANPGVPLRDLLEEVERHAVDGAIAASNGSQTQAARRLGLSRKGLYLKRQRLGI